MRKQTFLGGVLILALGGLFAKFLGAANKIPLTWILKAEGLGVYQLVFPLFSLILVLSSSAMPTAISQMIAFSHSKSNQANQVLKVALKFLCIFGGLLSLLLFCVSDILANWQQIPQLSIAYKIIAPAVLFSALISAFRGYFQGRLNMIPTTISNVLEQVFKLAFGLSFAFWFSKSSQVLGAVGALLGITLSEFCVFLFMLFMFLRENKQNDACRLEPDKVVLKKLLKSFCVIGLSGLVLPLSVFLDSLLVLKLLMNAGVSHQTATCLWGIESGVVSSVITLPVVFAAAISSAVVPNLAGNRKLAQKHIFQSMFLVLFATIPLFVVVLFLSEDLTKILFGFGLNTNDVKTASNLLCFSSLLVILSPLLHIQNAILQGLRKNFLPLLSMMFAFAMKILVFVFLVQNKNFGIFGVELSKYVFFVSAILINKSFFRSLNLRPHVLKKLLPNFFACFLMALWLVFLNSVGQMFGTFFDFCLKIVSALVIFLIGICLTSPENLPLKWKNCVKKFLTRKKELIKN